MVGLWVVVGWLSICRRSRSYEEWHLPMASSLDALGPFVVRPQAAESCAARSPGGVSQQIVNLENVHQNAGTLVDKQTNLIRQLGPGGCLGHLDRAWVNANSDVLNFCNLTFDFPETGASEYLLAGSCPSGGCRHMQLCVFQTRLFSQQAPMQVGQELLQLFQVAAVLQ
jgi:hypothetical protein